MKKLIKIFTSRLVVTGLLILVQLGWLLLQLFHLTQYATWLAALFSLLSLLAILFLIQRDENPAYKLLWVILAGPSVRRAAVPGFGQQAAHPPDAPYPGPGPRAAGTAAHRTQ